jgi:hypothetical protein
MKRSCLNLHARFEQAVCGLAMDAVVKTALGKFRIVNWVHPRSLARSSLCHLMKGNGFIAKPGPVILLTARFGDIFSFRNKYALRLYH